MREALGALLTQLGRPQDGLAQLDAALRLNPASTTLPHNRGVAFEALRRDREAGEAFSEAVRRLPRQPASWFGLANIRRRAGDMAGAVTAYRQAVAIAPSFLEAHEALNETLWQAGQEGYLSSYVAALRQAPQDRMHGLAQGARAFAVPRPPGAGHRSGPLRRNTRARPCPERAHLFLIALV